MTDNQSLIIEKMGKRKMSCFFYLFFQTDLPTIIYKNIIFTLPFAHSLLSGIYLENIFAIKAITAITAIIIITPTQIPALKISPINSHPEKSNADCIILKSTNNFFISFYLIVFNFLLCLFSASSTVCDFVRSTSFSKSFPSFL